MLWLRSYSLKQVVVRAEDADSEAQKAVSAAPVAVAPQLTATEQGDALPIRGSTEKHLSDDARTETAPEPENAKDDNPV